MFGQVEDRVCKAGEQEILLLEVLLHVEKIGMKVHQVHIEVVRLVSDIGEAVEQTGLLS